MSIKQEIIQLVLTNLKDFLRKVSLESPKILIVKSLYKEHQKSHNIVLHCLQRLLNNANNAQKDKYSGCPH